MIVLEINQNEHIAKTRSRLTEIENLVEVEESQFNLELSFLAMIRYLSNAIQRRL